jgi:hypothetical protein
VCVFHHVHQDQFGLYFRWPGNRVAYVLKGRVCHWVYRDRPLVAVSPLTRADHRGGHDTGQARQRAGRPMQDQHRLQPLDDH